MQCIGILWILKKQKNFLCHKLFFVLNKLQICIIARFVPCYLLRWCRTLYARLTDRGGKYNISAYSSDGKGQKKKQQT